MRFVVPTFEKWNLMDRSCHLWMLMMDRHQWSSPIISPTFASPFPCEQLPSVLQLFSVLLLELFPIPWLSPIPSQFLLVVSSPVRVCKQFMDFNLSRFYVYDNKNRNKFKTHEPDFLQFLSFFSLFSFSFRLLLALDFQKSFPPSVELSLAFLEILLPFIIERSW